MATMADDLLAAIEGGVLTQCELIRLERERSRTWLARLLGR